jgi:preprotein translocase subunit SecE
LQVRALPPLPARERETGARRPESAAGRTVVEKLKEFVLGVRAEMEKATWPERAQVQSATILILILVIILAAIIGLLDVVITQVLGLFFKI